MGLFSDHFIAEANGHTFEVVARMTLWGSARYSLLIDGGLGDTYACSLWGGMILILGVRECVLWAERSGWRPDAAEDERSVGITVRPEGVKGIGGVTRDAAPLRFEPA